MDDDAPIERPGFDPSQDLALDPRTLRGIAHPVRIKILTSLRDEGPATATMLAGRLDESTGSTSYHLRQLAAYGFVVEAPDRNVGRERWWRAAHRVTYTDAPENGDVETRELSEQYLSGILQTHSLRMQEWLANRPSLHEPWTTLDSLGGAVLRLTPAELSDLGRKISELVFSYRRDDPQSSPPPTGTERVVAQFQVMPQPVRLRRDYEGS